MISMVDCIAWSGLSEAEVLAVAEHEHIPEIAAAAMVQHLLAQPHGCEAIRDMIVEDIEWALERGDDRHARELETALRRFLSEHPEACCGVTAPKLTKLGLN
jgi:hypothetical protein